VGQRDPERGGASAVPCAGQRHGLVERGDERAREAEDGLLAVCVAQHREAPAAESGDGLLLPAAGSQAPGRLGHERVGGRVPRRRRDRVEGAETDDHDPHVVRVLRPLESCAGPVDEERRIGEPGRLVVEGSARQLVLEAPGLGHVVGDHERRRASLPVEQV
jgi:hypothetical protein